MISKVNTGDKLKIRAADWNAIAEHVNAGHAASDKGHHYDNGEITLSFNGKNTVLRKGMGCVITGIQGDLRERPYYHVRIGNITPIDYMGYAIAQEDIDHGFCGKGKISGYSYALFKEVRKGEEFAKVGADGFFQSASTGEIKLMYVSTSTITLDGNTLHEGFVRFGNDSGNDNDSGEAGMFDCLAYKDGDQWKARVYDSRSTNYANAGYVYINGSGKGYGVAKTEFDISGECKIYLEVWYDNSGYHATLKKTTGDVVKEDNKWKTVICYVQKNASRDEYSCYKPRGLGNIEIREVWA